MTKKQKKMLREICIALVLLVLILVTDAIIPMPKLLKMGLLLIPYLVVGHDILRKAFQGIRNRQIFDENFLMAVATIGALLLGEVTESVAVMLFYQIGELFQSYAVGKSRKNISALMDIRPDYANIEVDGKIEQVDPDEVEVGSMILVQPGEKIPIDGVVVEGISTLNTSALTGESLPRDVAEGEEVTSGCINLTGLLRVKTTKEFGESTVSKILELVENSSMKKAKTEKFITRFAHYYTPVVCYSALALAILPALFRLLFLQADPQWGVWITRALTFLVISCPCALVISIPLSFFGGIGGASERGILIKGSNYLEALASTKYVVFDKTGTLTQGVFQVTKVHPVNGFKEEELLGHAAYVEAYSNHPISKSLKTAYGKEIFLQNVSDVKEIPGHGVEGIYQGKQISAGNSNLMKANAIPHEEVKEPGTIVHVAVDGVYAGYILISDLLKEHSKEAIQHLKKEGIKKTVMLTGDRAFAADHVAKELGVDEVRSELLTADKVAEVERLLGEKDAKEMLAFVGDGVNDAPVLSRADVGIAMGALGSDAAIEAADIVLMDDDPNKIALAIRIARRTLLIAKENIVFAIGIKIMFLILGALGFVGMWWAIFADVGVMIIAVLNATRALAVKNL